MDVLFEGGGVGILLSWRKLGWVDIHGDDNGWGLLGGEADQGHVALVEHSHCRDQSDGCW